MQHEINRLAFSEYGLARAWLKLGRTHRAIISFSKALEIAPHYLDAYLALGQIYFYLRRWRDLSILCRKALEYHREAPEIHKLLIVALEELGSIDDAATEYELYRLDQRDIDIQSHEIICCCVVRDELIRLPWFLDYYRKLGVDRFFIIDNDSRDASDEWLISQEDVHLWASDLPFDLANFGSSWFEILLRRYGIGHWCLIVDADEFIHYDGAPDRSLQQFCAYLDRNEKRVATGILIDLYSDQPVVETHYEANTDPLQLCPYFDSRFCHTSVESGGQYKNQTMYYGGVRQRVFPTERDYLLSKAVLLRYEKNVVLAPGQHETNIAKRYQACQQVCLLHFKFFSSLLARADVESVREKHSIQAEQYKSYKNRFKQNLGLTLYDSECSIRFGGTEQLIELGVLQHELKPDRVVAVPTVSKVAMQDSDRPFWSIMITVYDRSENIGIVLDSVLRQASDDMQIAVVCDFSDHATQAVIAEKIKKIGRTTVQYCPLSEHAGHPDVFNLCLDKAVGKWVHILHDDDRVEPGFYAAMRMGIEERTDIGAAFCQSATCGNNKTDQYAVGAWVERESAGIIEDWLERITTENRVRFSTKVVKRSVYETLGGFRPDAMSAFDWEMWIRIAAHYPVYYEPEALVAVSRASSTESSRLKRTGEQVAHAFAALEVAADHLPLDRADALVRKSRDRISHNALDTAQRFLTRGDLVSAFANMRAVASGQPSATIRMRLINLIRGVDFEFKG